MAIKDLNTLLGSLSPELKAGKYVFCKLDNIDKLDVSKVVSVFGESEAWSVISSQSYADEMGWKYEYEAAWITLNVLSDLAAVGLTAAVSNALAKGGLSCNVVAAYHHDHLFLPYESKDIALEILLSLS